MKHKYEVFERFREFRHEIKKQTSKPIKVPWSDRGGKYLSVEFLEYLKENGIISQWTYPDTAQINGISKEKNRTLLDMVQFMISFTDLSVFFLKHALLTVMHILNKISSKFVPTTPYEIWHGKKSNLSYLKIWGCSAYVKRQKADKLENRSIVAENQWGTIFIFHMITIWLWVTMPHS